MVKIGAHGIEIYRTSRAIGSQKANRPPAGGLFSDTAPRTERRDYPVPWRGLEAPGGSRLKNGVASLAYTRSKNGVASLAYSRSKNGVASLAYSRSKNGVASLAYSRSKNG